MSDQITYDNKVDLQVATNIANINKVTASDMNEIKDVVNSHADDIDELNAPEKWVSVGATAPTDGRRVWFENSVNLINPSLLPLTESGVTISQNSNGDIVLNGTPTITYGYISFIITDYYYLDEGEYTLSVKQKMNGIGVNCGHTGFNGAINLTLSSSERTRTATLSTRSGGDTRVNVRYDVGTLTNFVLNPQLQKGSTATSYEPYVDTSINVDGDEIYNLKSQTPQKITLSFNDTYVYTSDLQYICFKLGNLAFVFINVLAFRVGAIADLPNYAVLATGLPRPSRTEVFYLQPSGKSDNKFRADITVNGNMQRHWSADPVYGDSANRQYSGFIVYETID